MNRQIVHFSLAVGLFFLLLGSPAICQSQPDDHSLDLDGYCRALCANVNDGAPNGMPASGYATFEAEAVAFNFETLNALSYVDGDGYYTAEFGYGGTFELTAPEGIFEGVITSGTATEHDSSTAESVDVFFEGEWNNGTRATGEAYIDFCGDCIQPGFTFHVDMTPEGTTPEPGTFTLLGTAALGMIGWTRRRVM
jgi:hypothetical protein